MIYELINPSDPYTCIAEDPKVAMAATLLLGNGKMGLEDENGKSYPILLLFMNKEQTEAKLKEIFGESSLCGFLENKDNEVAVCLDSIMSVSISERRTFDEAMKRIPDKKLRDEYRAILHDKNRSSISDFGTYAWQLASKMFARIAGEKE